MDNWQTFFFIIYIFHVLPEAVGLPLEKKAIGNSEYEEKTK